MFCRRVRVVRRCSFSDRREKSGYPLRPSLLLVRVSKKRTNEEYIQLDLTYPIRKDIRDLESGERPIGLDSNQPMRRQMAPLYRREDETRRFGVF